MSMIPKSVAPGGSKIRTVSRTTKAPDEYKASMGVLTERAGENLTQAQRYQLYLDEVDREVDSYLTKVAGRAAMAKG